MNMTDDNENEPEWMSHDYKKCDCFPCAARYLFSNEPSEFEEVTQAMRGARVCTKCNQEIHHDWFPSTFCWRCDTTSKMPRSGSALPDEIQARNKQIETGECQHLDYATDLDGDYCLDCGLREAEGDELE